VKKCILQKLSFIKKTCLIKLLTNRFEDSAKSILQTHQKKLYNLWISQRKKCPSSIINLSDRKLSILEMEALRFGLQHHILPKQIREDNVKSSIEKLAYSLGTRYKININDEIKDKINFYFQKFMNQAKTECRTKPNQAIHKALKSLGNDSCIKVCKFDKGRGVVILSSHDYYTKLDSIISDQMKFKEIQISENKKSHPIISRQAFVKTKHTKAPETIW